MLGHAKVLAQAAPACYLDFLLVAHQAAYLFAIAASAAMRTAAVGGWSTLGDGKESDGGNHKGSA